MKPISRAKIISWIKQDRSDAIGRWVNTKLGSEMLSRNEFLAEMWMSGAWKCVSVWFEKFGGEMLFSGESTPFLISKKLPKKLDHRDDAECKKIKIIYGYYKNICISAEKIGWRPTASWCMETCNYEVGNKNLDITDCFCDVWLKKLSPSDTASGYGQIGNLIVKSGAFFAESVWQHYLENNNKDLQGLHKNWAEYAFNGYTNRNELMSKRVLRALINGELMSETVSEEIINGKSRFYNKELIDGWISWRQKTMLSAAFEFHPPNKTTAL